MRYCWKKCPRCGRRKRVGRRKRLCGECRSRPPRGKTGRGPSGVTKTFPGDNYTERLRNLKVLGFNSYRDYLRGRLWASVRAAALARNGGRCRGCGRPARQVHHQDYSPETLLGQRPHRLIPVCRRCHERIEFDEGGKKRPLREARAVADRLTSSRQRELFG